MTRPTCPECGAVDPEDQEHDVCRSTMALRERANILQIQAQEAVSERNHQAYAIERQTELRRQAESKCDQLRRQLQEEHEKNLALMDNMADMMVVARAGEMAIGQTVMEAVGDGQRRSIIGCAKICAELAEEPHRTGAIAQALKAAEREILALLTVRKEE